MRQTLTRRQLLGSVAVATTGTVAGCVGGGEPEDVEDLDMGGENDDEVDPEYDIEDQPDDTAATFVTPEDGDTVSSPVSIEGDVEGIELAPAGSKAIGEGHLHVLVDRECFEEGRIIYGPSSSAQADGVYHWGDGQSEDEIELEPGEYDLCLQISDGTHRAFGDTDEITITVEE